MKKIRRGEFASLNDKARALKKCGIGIDRQTDKWNIKEILETDTHIAGNMIYNGGGMIQWDNNKLFNK